MVDSLLILLLILTCCAITITITSPAPAPSLFGSAAAAPAFGAKPAAGGFFGSAPGENCDCVELVCFSSVFVLDVISDGFICRDIQLHRWVYLVAHPPLHLEACLELVSRIYSSSSR